MLLRNAQNQYGLIAILLHWVMAFIIIGMLALGLYMADLPVGLQKLKLYGWHKEFGILVLMLVMVRFGWRMANTTPVLPFTMPPWQKVAAHISHWALYGFMFAMPLTGWMLTSAAGLPPAFFGLFVLPPLIAPNQHWLAVFATMHTWLAYGLIALLCVHIGAALQHHFIQQDDILKRMI